MNAFKLLVVDDETDNLDALERIFRRRHQFFRANSGDEALSLLAAHPDMAVVVTDQRMPQMTGVELLEKTLHSHPDMVRILLTGYTEIESIIAAVNQGHIFRYITKPWDSADLINSVDQAMEHFYRGQQLALKNRALEQALQQLEETHTRLESTHNELEKAHSALKKLDEAKSKFMILINHELKTPLTVIHSFLQLLNESGLNEEQLIFWDRIYRSSLRLQEMIDDTFILTHFAAGSLKPKLQSISFLGLVEKAMQDLTLEAQKKNLSFERVDDLWPAGTVTTPATAAMTPPPLYLDAVLFSKALRHLFANAIRFSPHDEVIRWGYKYEPNSLQFWLENKGAPVSNEVLEQIDTPFNIQSEIMNHSKGLGLGFSVTNAALKSHRSRLNIENLSLPNRETLIRVSFTLRF